MFEKRLYHFTNNGDSYQPEADTGSSPVPATKERSGLYLPKADTSSSLTPVTKKSPAYYAGFFVLKYFEMEEGFVVYVLYSQKFDKTYTGQTSNLIERFKSHNFLGKKGFTIISQLIYFIYFFFVL